MKIFVLVLTHVLMVNYCLSQSVDHSPHCASLAKITNLCNEMFIHMMCPVTCQMEHTIKKDCGIRHFGDTGAFVPQKRKKRLDNKDDDPMVNTFHSRVRRLVGGKEALKGAYPWHVSLYFNGSYACSGAILTPDWVITAARCFDTSVTSENPKEWLVGAGEHDLLNAQDPSRQIIDVKKIIIHDKNFKYRHVNPKYNNVPDDYDVALLKLSTPVFLDKKYKASICLPGMNEFTVSKEQCRTMGWGGVRKQILHEASVKLVPRGICNLPNSYNGTIHERAICAGYLTGNTDACQKDVGGSLACKKGDHWFVVGLVSSGFQCGVSFNNGPKKYGVYTNVPSMKNWVIETLLSYDEVSNSIISIFERISTMNGMKKQVDSKKTKTHIKSMLPFW